MTSDPAGIMKQLAASLRNADRKTFENFCDALELYTIQAMEGLAGAPQDQILNMQGRAQQCQAFLRLLRECHVAKTPPQQPQAPLPGGWQAP